MTEKMLLIEAGDGQSGVWNEYLGVTKSMKVFFRTAADRLWKFYNDLEPEEKAQPRGQRLLSFMLALSPDNHGQVRQAIDKAKDDWGFYITYREVDVLEETVEEQLDHS